MKTNTLKVTEFLLLILFIVSGVAGLIYQSVWSHYLGLILGHAAYAQALVLAIFMGGMAIGSWVISQYTPNWRKLILGYALIEGLIGIVGLCFQSVFSWYFDISQQSVLPSLNNIALAHAYQWVSATLLILPQCLLLGATFPLLSAGYLRIAPQNDGKVLGGLYFSNSLGAAFGALCATFLLMPSVGLPGSVLVAGILNLLVAVGAWFISRNVENSRVQSVNAQQESITQDNQKRSTPLSEQITLARLSVIMFVATAISGATSFVYETGWIRLLNQALGSTIHSFELMLAAFILGLAFGGLWIRHRGHAITDTVRYVGFVQVWMGIAALLSIPVFAQSFYWVGWIINALSRSDSGYLLFEVATAGVALLVMFPAAFFAGMTLPLFTMSLLRSGANERAIGRIYAANTLGSIAGVVLMMYFLIPLLGVKGGVWFAAVVDALLGVYLIKLARSAHPAHAGTTKKWPLSIAIPLSAIFCALVVNFFGSRIDPTVQTSGVFRTGNVGKSKSENRKVLFLEDGKTATIGLFMFMEVNNQPSITIATNGKPDAGLAVSLDMPPGMDEYTMLFLGVMPLIAHPNPEKIAIIGWGSGLSTHTVLGSPDPKVVDTIEIEPVMYEGARLFGSRVQRAYKDPRSHVYFDDARTFFATGGRTYDVIVSEPSNPWVSGVSTLFTQEFYQFLDRHLTSNGVLVQWLHLYELNDKLLTTMLLALTQEFAHVRMYLANDGDLVLLAYKNEVTPLTENVWNHDVLRMELERVGFSNLNDIQLRYVGSEVLIKQMARIYNVSPYSDYFPVVALEAPVARFKGQSANFLSEMSANGLPVLDILECYTPIARNEYVSSKKTPISFFGLDKRQEAIAFVDAMETGQLDTVLIENLHENRKALLVYAMNVLNKEPQNFSELQRWSGQLSAVANTTISALPAGDLYDVWAGSARASWLPDRSLNNPQADLLFSLYSAAAQRNVADMYERGKTILEAIEKGQMDHLTHAVREEILVITALGAIGSQNLQAAKEVVEHYRDQISAGRNYVTTLIIKHWAEDVIQGRITMCKK